VAIRKDVTVGRKDETTTSSTLYVFATTLARSLDLDVYNRLGNSLRRANYSV
jgi:hypothetical protein